MKSVFLAVMTIVMFGSLAMAQDAAPEIKVSADLELFYELSDDVGGSNDGDKFKSNQLYLLFDGKFDNNMEARVVLDGADIVASDGKTVSGEKIIEEANFTIKHIGGSPVTLVFGKDEMPFGLDYDKYLNDHIAHNQEVDKVWGIHAILDIEGVGDFAAGSYQHRRSLGDGVTLVEADNELGDNYTAKLTVDEFVGGLKLVLSGGAEAYGDTSTTDENGVTTVALRNDESRLGVGLLIDCPEERGNLNLEYISFSNKGGSPDYDPGLITIGAEYATCEKVTVWGRYEIIEDDSSADVETDFWTVGIVYAPVKGYKFLVEYSNFNSGDLKDATDLDVAKGSIEDALLVGVKAKF